MPKNLRTEYATIDRGDHHGVPHQLNALVLDVDSHVTGFGRHSRLVVMGGTGEDAHVVTIREDLCAGLPESTEADRARMLKSPTTITRAAVKHVESARYVSWFDGHECPHIEHTYHLVRRAARV